MIFYSGWIVLRRNYLDDDDLLDLEQETRAEHEMLHKIEQLVQPLRQYNIVCDIRHLKWSRVLYIISEFNHDIGYRDQVVSLFEEVGIHAKGSYGLLYIWGDEPDPALDNEFEVYRLAKGKLERYKDQLLSPRNPVIEE